MDSNLLNRYLFSVKKEGRFGLLINRCITKTIADFTLKGRMITEVEQ